MYFHMLYGRILQGAFRMRRVQELCTSYKSISDTVDDADFLASTRPIRITATNLIEYYFGFRCEDYDEDCIVCQRYRALDTLLESPFSED